MGWDRGQPPDRAMPYLTDSCDKGFNGLDGSDNRVLVLCSQVLDLVEECSRRALAAGMGVRCLVVRGPNGSMYEAASYEVSDVRDQFGNAADWGQKSEIRRKIAKLLDASHARIESLKSHTVTMAKRTQLTLKRFSLPGLPVKGDSTLEV
ncbi:hypothetical protein GCM10027200_36570 [Lentzea nigeriaca]